MKKLVFIVLIATLFACEVTPQVTGIGAPRPPLVVAGGGGGGDPSNIVTSYGGAPYSYSDQISVVIPSVSTNDIAVVPLLCKGAFDFVAPAGWSVLWANNSPTISTVLFWKRFTETTASYTESFGSLAGLTFGTTLKFTGCSISGTPFEGFQNSGVNLSNTPYIPQLTSTGDRLAYGVVFAGNDYLVTSPTNYTLAFSMKTFKGTDAGLSGLWQIVSAGTVVQENLTLTGTAYNITVGFLVTAQ